MKTTRIAGLVLLLFVASAGNARATNFELGSYQVTLNLSDPGLVLWTSNLLEDSEKAFSLDYVGQEYTTSLFRIGTRETALNVDDLIPKAIDVAMHFVAPDPGFSGTANGLTGAAWLLGSFGYLVWDNPAILEFGNTGLLGVSLSPAKFGLPGSGEVKATFELLRKDTRPVVAVAEPTILALLGLGSALVLGARRRRVQR